MNYLSVKDLSKGFGERELFANLTFHINQGDKIALVATNGSGKTSLMNIIAGRETPDSGQVQVAKDVKMLMLTQNQNWDEDKTVMDTIMDYNMPQIEILRNYMTCLESGDLESSLYLNTLKKMEENHLWDVESRIAAVLSQLQIKNLQQKIKELSGGQKKRLALAQLLIELELEPVHTLLVLDEPTNHLDIEMIDWLESWLRKDDRTLLIVTHDRHFLEAVSDEIWELDQNQLHTYKGDYNYYLEHKAMREENESAFLSKAKSRYRKELEWMRKQPQARTTKSKSRIDNFYELKNIALKKIENRKLELSAKVERLGGKVLEVKKLKKSFGDLAIVDDWTYTFSRGEKVGLVGRNGVGKTTLIELLLGLEEPQSGRVVKGDTVVFGYYKQENLVLKEDQRVIEYVKDIAEYFPLANGNKMSASEFLKLFLFSPEQQFTYIKKLSGGEKKRLQLLSILFRNPNFLILDEPTNDLDLVTQNILEEFLINYQGCVLLVSHDRYFMDKIVDHVFVMAGQGKMIDFNGNYKEYMEWEKIQNEEKEILKEAKKEIEESNKKNTAKLSFNEKRELDNLESEIESLQNRKLDIETEMNAESDFQKLELLSGEYQSVNTIIAEKEDRWLELSDRES